MRASSLLVRRLRRSALLDGARWRRAQEALLDISRRSRFVVADTPDHDIEFHRPDQIVAAVRELVAGLRRGSAPGGR